MKRRNSLPTDEEEIILKGRRNPKVKKRV